MFVSRGVEVGIQAVRSRVPFLLEPRKKKKDGVTERSREWPRDAKYAKDPLPDPPGILYFFASPSIPSMAEQSLVG